MVSNMKIDPSLPKVGILGEQATSEAIAMVSLKPRRTADGTTVHDP